MATISRRDGVLATFFLSFTLIAICVFNVCAAGPPGSVDPSFQANISSTVQGFQLAPDGKLFVHLGWPDYKLTRLQADGAADPTFTPGMPAGSRIFSVGLQPDGKMIVAGDFYSIDGVSRPCLARLNPDCSLDPSFVPELSTTIPPPPPPLVPPGAQPTRPGIGYVNVRPSGKIVVGGMSYIVAADGSALQKTIRLNSDGTLDGSFDETNSALENGLVLSNGKILVVRKLTSMDGSRYERVHPDGTPDTSFLPAIVEGSVNTVIEHNGGIVLGGYFLRVNGVWFVGLVRLSGDGSVDFSFHPNIEPVILGITTAVAQPDGKIWIGGGFELPGASFRNLARLNPNGSLDITMDGGASSYVYGLRLQPDGKLLVGGEFTSIGSTPVARLARLMGETDAGPGRFLFGAASYEVFENSSNVTLTVRRIWGTGGQVTVNYQILAGSALAGSDYEGESGAIVFEQGESQKTISIPITDDASIEDLESFQVLLESVTEGEIGVLGSATVNILDNDGPASLDQTFTVGQGSFDGGVEAVAVQTDGKIVVGGWFQQAGGSARRGIARLGESGSLDPTFNPGSGLDFGAIAGRVRVLKLQGDEKVLLAGAFNKVNGITRNYLARLHLNGSLDASFDSGSGAGGSVVGDIRGIGLLPNGQMIVGGYFDIYSGISRHGLVRLETNGPVDGSYHPAGADIVVPFGLQADGKVVFAGLWDNQVTRINADGTPDLTPFAPADNAVRQVESLPDGKTMMAGSFSTVHNLPRRCVARLLGDGSVDPDFVPDLTVFLDGGLSPYVYRFATQADGKVVIALKSYRSPAGNYVARLNADGTLDTDFEPIRFSIPSGDNDTISALEIQPDGKIVVAGIFQTVNGLPRAYMVRLRGGSNSGTRALSVKSLALSSAEPSLALVVAPGKPFVLQTSTDLTHWTAVCTNVTPVSTFTIAEGLPSTAGQHYYRIMQLVP